MQQKIALMTIIIAFTICVVQGLPRTHRFKPIVNLKPEKLNATEKPVEARKTALFPKNNKKYVVTENPISSTTSSYSYKYFVAKRPLMLKFAPTSKPFLNKDQPRTYQSLMKKIKFVVSTPAPSHSIIKENNLRKHQHLKVNKTHENRNVGGKGNPLHYSFNITTTEKTSSLEDMDLPHVSPKNNNTTEVILIPINIKSNPNVIAEEVKDIVNYMEKVHPRENKVMAIETSSLQNGDDVTTESVFTKTSSRVSTATPPTKSTTEETHSRFEKNNLNDVLPMKNALRPRDDFFPTAINHNSQNPNDDVGDILYRLPNYDLSKVKKGLTTESSSSKPAEDVTVESISHKSTNDNLTDYNTTKHGDNLITEKTSPELIIIPVNINEFKINSNEVVKEVNDILNKINKIPPYENNEKTENSSSNHRNDFTSESSLPVLTNKVTTESYPPKPLQEVPTESLLPKLINEEITESSSSIPADNVTTENISQKSANGITTEYYTTELEGILTTEKALPELIIIPVNMNELHPNEVANEVKDILNEMNKLHPHQMNATSESSSPRLTNEVTTENFPPNALKEVTTESLPSTTTNKVITVSPVDDVTTENVSQIPANNINNELLLPEVVFIPVSVDELKSHPNVVTDEVEDIINKMQNHSNKDNYVTDEIPSSQHAFENTTKSFSSIPVNKVTTERSTLHIVDEVTTENISSKPAHDVATESPSPKPENKVNSKKFPTKPENEVTTHSSLHVTSTNKVTTEIFSSKLESDTIHTPKVEDKLTTENASGETLYIPVNFDDFQSNPVIANEVRDIINYVNKLHPHRDNIITEPTSLNTGVIKTDETVSPKLITENSPNSVKTTNNETKLENNMTTESYSPKLQDNVTTKSSSREVVFIPVDMAELKSNPDLIAADVSNILKNMNNEVEDYNNYPHKNSSSKLEDSVSTEDHSLKPENSEEIYNSSSLKPEDYLKTQNTSRNPYENVTDKTAKLEHLNLKQNQDLISSNSSEPSIVFEPIVVTTLNDPDSDDHKDDDDDDDINVGYIINRRNFWKSIYPNQTGNKTNENVMNEDKTSQQSGNKTKLNSINDDISDVVYVLKRKEDKKR